MHIANKMPLVVCGLPAQSCTDYGAPGRTQDEATWEEFCAWLIEQHEERSPGAVPQFETPAALREQLGLLSFRALYQVRTLHITPLHLEFELRPYSER